MILLISVDVLLPDILPDIFFNFCFSRGAWGMDFLSDCSVRIPSNPVSWGVSKLFLFGGMDFLPDWSVRILIQPCFLGSQQAVPFWGMDFLDFSRTFAEL
jgi:hypothetical protein